MLAKDDIFQMRLCQLSGSLLEMVAPEHFRSLVNLKKTGVLMDLKCKIIVLPAVVQVRTLFAMLQNGRHYNNSKKIVTKIGDMVTEEQK